MEISFYLWTALLAAGLLYIVKWILWRISRSLPPGPWGLPVLGYMPFLGSVPTRDYMKMKEKYGNIFSLRIGMKYGVVLNDFALIKEAFNKDEFTNKPPDWFRLYPDSDSIEDVNGMKWKEIRRFTLSTLRNLGMGKNKVEEAIKEEINVLIQRLHKSGSESEINILEVTNVHFLNVILTMLCGKSFEDGDHFVKIMEEYNSILIEKFIINQKGLYFPFLKPVHWLKTLLPTKKSRAVREIRDFIGVEIEKHQKEYDGINIYDYLSYYMNELKKGIQKNSAITSNNLMVNVEIMLFAATDSTRTGLSWIFIFLAKYQDYQEEVYEEISNLLGKEKPPSWSDKDSLPLTNAFIMEVSRFKTPSEVVHWSSKEGEIGGFCIPKHTLIVANAEAVHNDPKLWGDPENFRPSRFLSPDKRKAVEPEYWMPFLIGKRMCPGAKLANMQLFLFTASLLQKFRVLPPEGGISLEDYVGNVLCPVKPLITLQLRE